MNYTFPKTMIKRIDFCKSILYNINIDEHETFCFSSVALTLISCLRSSSITKVGLTYAFTQFVSDFFYFIYSVYAFLHTTISVSDLWIFYIS